MKQQIPTPIQRVGYSSLITSNIGIAQQVLDRKIWFIRQNKLTWLHKKRLCVNERYQLLKVKKEIQASGKKNDMGLVLMANNLLKKQ